MLSRALSLLGVLLALSGCRSDTATTSAASEAATAEKPMAEPAAPATPPKTPPAPQPPPAPPPPPPTLDMHVHLTNAAAVDLLVETMDRHGVQQAVVLGTQNTLGGRGPGQGMQGHTEGNAIALAAAKAHPARLIPFAAVDLEVDTAETFDRWRAAGGCGFKIAQGDRRLRVRPLDDARYQPLWGHLARLGAPVLIHVNTTRFRAEFERVLDAHPGLDAVCAHWCSSRTALDRFEAIAEAHPRLRFDVSSGGPGPSAAGTANLSAERARARALVMRWPERFLFGSDLVTHPVGDWRVEWRDQIEMDRRFLTDPAVRTWVPGEVAGTTVREVPALDLPDAVARRILDANARDWLKGCLER